MALKPSRCVIIVAVVELTDDLGQAIKERVRLNIPAWADFQVVTAAKYLGMVLGCNSSSLSFADPCNKYVVRVEDLSKT